jgi:hypothetical protein
MIASSRTLYTHHLWSSSHLTRHCITNAVPTVSLTNHFPVSLILIHGFRMAHHIPRTFHFPAWLLLGVEFGNIFACAELSNCLPWFPLQFVTVSSPKRDSKCKKYLFHYPWNSLGIITIIILLASSVGILKTVLEFMSPDITVSMLKRVRKKELKTFILELLSRSREKF